MYHMAPIPRRLNNYDRLPGRPFENLSAWFLPDMGVIHISIRDPEAVDLPKELQWRPIARFNGEEFTFSRGSAWYNMREFKRAKTESQTLCFQVMLNSNDFCANQAAVDTGCHGDDLRWQEILDDVVLTFSVASVILM
jgi:hypothetical protein